MNNGRIAIPSSGKGGLSGIRSEHFGHCDVFTLIDIEDGAVTGESVLNNMDHSNGGCMVPVNLLASNEVNAIIVAGIGRRPLTGFIDAGIDVYVDTANPHIHPVVEKYLQNQLQKISLDEACGGDGNCH